jgi:phosphoribosyl-ATP pyrophosphohydrolase
MSDILKRMVAAGLTGSKLHLANTQSIATALGNSYLAATPEEQVLLKSEYEDVILHIEAMIADHKCRIRDIEDEMAKLRQNQNES